MKLSKVQRRALQLLQERGPLRPAAFAEFMWPNSEGWAHHTKCGPSGSHRGGGMPLAAGGYLGKLSKLRLVRPEYRGGTRVYTITSAGIKALKG